MKSWTNLSTMFVLSIFTLTVSGCSLLNWLTGGTLEEVQSDIDRAVTIVERGIDNIQNEPELWRATLNDVAEQLPTGIQSTIRTEMAELASRSIAKTGVEFRCNVDFLSNRAIQSLERVKAMLLDEPVPPLVPDICKIEPSALDFNLAADRRQTIEIYGYDLDYEAPGGHLLQAYLVTESGDRLTQIDTHRLGRTTHYMNVLNVAGSDFEATLQQEHIAKIEFAWGDRGNTYEVVVISREARTDFDVFTPRHISLTPPKTDGDEDFDTDDGNPMAFRVRAESQLNSNRLQVRAYMYAREHEDDYTTVEGWSNWETAYTAPAGWEIVSYYPSGPSERSGKITDHGIRTESLPDGELVSSFEIYGDRDDDEAGSYTRVIVYFNDTEVTLMESIGLNSVAKPGTGAGFLRNQLSGKCIDAQGYPGTENRTRLQLFDCEFTDPGTDQKWELTKEGFIRNQLSGKCIDAQGYPGIENRTQLQLFDCEFTNPDTDQRWNWQ